MGGSCSTIVLKFKKSNNTSSGDSKENKKGSLSSTSTFSCFANASKESSIGIGELFIDEKLLQLLKKKFANRKTKKGGSGRGGGERIEKPIPRKREFRLKDLPPNPTKEEKLRHDIMVHFDKYEKWDFDMFRLSRLTNFHPLLYVTYTMLVMNDTIRKFNIDERDLLRFLCKIESEYGKNSSCAYFYNSTLAAEHLQSFCYLLRKGLSDFLSDEDILVGILACVIIYLDHPSLNNHYQENIESFASTIYNDYAVLQNTALTRFFDLIKEENGKYDILKTLTKDQRKYVRTQLIDTVLATCISEIPKCGRMIRKCMDGNSDFSSKEDVNVLLCISMIFISFSYHLRPRKRHIKWIRQMVLQSFLQGDLERQKGFEVNRFGKRETIEKDIALFMESKVKPVIKLIIGLFPMLKILSSFLKKNIQFWANPEICFLGNSEHDVRRISTHSSGGRNSGQRKGVSIFAGITQFDEPSLEDADLNQSTFDQNIKSKYGFPKDRKMNVPLEIQKERILKQSEKDADNEKFCLDYLTKRWDIKNSEREPFEDEAVIYAKCDFETHPKDTLTDEQTRNSVIRMFERIDEWNFDIFALTDLLGNDCIILTSYILFIKYDFLNYFKIDPKVLMNFLYAVREGYFINPYHNVMHGCDVMQITNSIIKKGGMIDRLTPVDIIASIIASMVHDLGHPGFNDAFQVHSYSYLAKLYNDRSVLEAYHCSECFRITRTDPDKDIFRNFSVEDRKDCRRTMADMIISTDMSNHARYVKAFNELVEKESDFKRKKDVRVALQIVIKMADIANPARPLYIYLQWTKKIIDEFYRQGDAEKKYGLPVSPLMDRETSVLSKGQKAFMEYVLIPMFKGFTSIFPEGQFMVDSIIENMKYWGVNEEIDESYFFPEKSNDKKTVKEISTRAVETNKTLFQDLYERKNKRKKIIKSDIV